MEKLKCFCGNEIEIDYKDSYNLDSEKDILEKIMDGSFLTFECKFCNTVLKPEYMISFTFSGMNILMIPEKDSVQFLLGKLELPKTDRTVLGFRELVEKIRILQAGLDDSVMEIVKFYIMEKVDSDKEIRIEYHNMENNELTFYIYGLKENEVGISKLPADFYEEVKKTLPKIKNDEPYSYILEGPYISINKIELENKE